MTPTRGTRVYRRVVGTTPCAYAVWDEVDTNGGTPGVVWGVDVAAAMQAVIVSVDRYAAAHDEQSDENAHQAREAMFEALSSLADLTINAENHDA